MHLSTNFLQTLYKSSNQEVVVLGLKMGKFYQCIQSYGPSFMTKFCSALYLENLLTNIFAKLNLRCGVSCMPAALLFTTKNAIGRCKCSSAMNAMTTPYKRRGIAVKASFERNKCRGSALQLVR